MNRDELLQKLEILKREYPDTEVDDQADIEAPTFIYDTCIDRISV